ncbi:MAG: FeoC-like transcriptional regulator [Cyanobacteriota bacterium]|nr:FeoC-like transcriptional regulator [Cyanobacteriota bacterium]
MILTELQHYLAQRGKASLSELETHFRTDRSALQGMLYQLIRKGRVYQHQIEKCGGCTSCQGELIEFYEWIGQKK